MKEGRRMETKTEQKATSEDGVPRLTEESYMKWWLEDYPPISGRLRFVIHVGLIYFASINDRSFISMIDTFANTDSEMFDPRGLLGFLGVGYIDPNILRSISAITQVAYVASAIGLFTGISSAVTAFGAVFLHGYLLDASGGNRSWYVPTVAIVAMSFSTNRRGDIWSVDYHINKRRRFRTLLGAKDKRSFSSEPTKAAGGKENYFSIRETGFARKCFLVYIVGFYFASGMAKLYASGFRWADGYTLQHYLGAMGNQDSIFVQLMVGYRSLGMLGGAGALFLEAGAFLALLPNKKLRLFFLIGWASMHIMIQITMRRKYEQNAWCYLLLVDWDEAFIWARTMWTKAKQRWSQERRVLQTDATGTKAFRKPSSIPKIREVPGIRKSSAKFATTIGTCLLVAMAAQAVLQIDWWPFTNVDMYSSYMHGDIKFSFPKSSYKDTIGAQEIANSWGNRQAKGELANRVEIQLRKGGFDEEKHQKTLKPFGVNRKAMAEVRSYKSTN